MITFLDTPGHEPSRRCARAGEVTDIVICRRRDDGSCPRPRGDAPARRKVPLSVALNQIASPRPTSPERCRSSLARSHSRGWGGDTRLSRFRQDRQGIDNLLARCCSRPKSGAAGSRSERSPRHRDRIALDKGRDGATVLVQSWTLKRGDVVLPAPFSACASLLDLMQDERGAGPRFRRSARPSDVPRRGRK